MSSRQSKAKGFVLSRKQLVIEEIGSINEQIEALKARKELLSTKLGKYLGKSLGLNFQANVFTRNQTTLDKAKVKKLLGEDKYARCLTSHEVTIVSVRRLSEADDDSEGAGTSA